MQWGLEIWSPIPRCKILYQNHRCGDLYQGHFQNWLSPIAIVAMSPTHLYQPSSLTPYEVKILTLQHASQSSNATLPAGIILVLRLLTHERDRLSLEHNCWSNRVSWTLFSSHSSVSGNSFPTQAQTTTRRRAGGHTEGATWGHINNGYGIHCAISSLLLCLEGTLHRSFFLKYGFGDGPRGKIQTLKHNLIWNKRLVLPHSVSCELGMWNLLTAPHIWLPGWSSQHMSDHQQGQT